jgi:hypothetical protein
MTFSKCSGLVSQEVSGLSFELLSSIEALLVTSNGRGKPTASVLSVDGFPLMAGSNFQPSDGNPTVISILRQLADGPKNVSEI